MAIAIVMLFVAAFHAGIAVGASGARTSAAPRRPSAAHQSEPRAPIDLQGSMSAIPSAPSPGEAIGVGVPACRYGDVLSEDDPAIRWAGIVVDTNLGLDPNYVPPDLVDTAVAGLNGGHLVRSILIPDLRSLAREARAAGSPLAVQSSFRSHSEQVETFRYWQLTAGHREALKTSARPGHSEHQLGTAIDFRGAANSTAPWAYRDWARTPAGAWLLANAWRFGFVLSYPRGALERTCYGYEPWHYRYVGRTAAAAMHSANVTPREWLWDSDR
jgi:zinc D-Ala-D-Ala carboxypeptidase